MRLNEVFVNILSQLYDIRIRKGEIFSAKAYKQAEEVIMVYEKDILHPNDLMKPKSGKTSGKVGKSGTKYIGEGILKKLNEYYETGKIIELENEKNNPIHLLTRIHGIGPKKAKEFIDKGITSLEQLKDKELLSKLNVSLTNSMRIGLKYFDDIECRIPRKEIDIYNNIFQNLFKESVKDILPSNSQFEIVGSYRRGLSSSGDIDIIITNDENDDRSYKLFLDYLIKKNIVIEIISRGKIKSMVITKLPEKFGYSEGPICARRVDLLYSPPKEYAFAILYFTGSKIFNTIQRQRALDLGYTLNEHGLCVVKNGSKSDKVAGDFNTERDIFKFLGMNYLEPHERIDSNSIKY